MATQPKESTADRAAGYLRRVADGLLKTDSAKLSEVAWKIIGTKETGARIYTAGNGGSANACFPQTRTP